MRWVPVALQAFNTWPERPHCGHFFGGVYWYGLETAGPSATLALVRVVGQADSTTLVALTIREAPDRVCVVLVQDLAQDSLRRHVLFASLPHGPCVLVEQLSAREPMLLALPA